MKKNLSKSKQKRIRLKRFFQRRNSSNCFFCEKEKGITLDHFIPKKLGGKNNEWNLVAACIACNNKKDSKIPEKIFIEKWISLLNPPKEIIDFLK